MNQDKALFSKTIYHGRKQHRDIPNRHNEHKDVYRVHMRQLRRHLVEKYEEDLKRVETAMDEGMIIEGHIHLK